MISRRSFVAAGAALVGASAFPAISFADSTGAAGTPSTEGPRSIGAANAPVTVEEFFSLTCTHCAHFSMTTMPEVMDKLVKPGKLRIVYHDFPLDAVALEAAMVARYLPNDQYYPFVTALFASQDTWAFAPGVNYTDELWKMAALAGMGHDTFQKAVADNALKNWIQTQQVADEKMYNIEATPSFLIKGKTQAGDMSYSDFVSAIGLAG
ncbi:MAG TPA: thioredoxin domain-containing protein [Acidisoma sp.]|jgi:protein-disulfide isomerase|uniref:thioredoxin domain-containing protein n=1 Tax=Acidisoma sp. TaxID=1872115 RepID=UPI002C3D7A8A|nr:thioredoxin domain-containing protein [Acidisoma sp.]HTI00427.1 thioredoxin domain-containing protein [Acidisoma sp.]